jgi:hypothetical protein
MTATWKWLIAGVVAAVLLAGAGAAAGYFIRSSSAQAFDAWRSGSEQLVHAGAIAQQRHDDSLMAGVRTLLAAAGGNAGDGMRHDTIVLVDGKIVAVLKDSLANAKTDQAKLQLYPPIVAGQDREIAQLDSSSTAWRLGFQQEAAATSQLIGRIASDSSWAQRLLAHLDSTPKPPRTSLGSFLIHPRVYARTELGTRTGWDNRIGLCWGGCGP